MKQYRLDEIFEKPISGEWGNELSENKIGVKVIRTTNFTNKGMLDLKDVVERDIDTIKYDKKRLRCGDIIIEKSGGSPNQPVGRVVIFEKNMENYFCNNFTSILRPKEGFNSKYLLYMLMNLYMQKKVLKFQNKTTGIINLKLVDFKIEFGETPDGQILLADEISPDSCRLWDVETNQKYDKDVFRQDIGDLIETYKAVLARMQK